MRLTTRTQLAAAAVAVTAAVLAGSAGVAAPAPATGGDLKLYVFDCGVLLYNSVERFGYKAGEIEPTNLTDGCYLIDNPGKGTVVWDTGVIPDNMWAPGRPPPKKEYGEGVAPLRTQLEQTGRKLEDITYVALSHVHWDHVANLYQFTKSTWLTSAYTRGKVLSDEKGDKIDPSMFTPMKTAPYKVVSDTEEFDVFGDGKVIRIPTPGHTPDSAVLLVRLKNHKPVILAGDLYHFRKDVETRLVTRGEEPAALEAGRAKIDALAKRLGAEIWICHDYKEFKAQKKAPAFYD
jgi:glyoxylase-like metal-dependent hydrolase (beta-lactamase superfamily II)